jgi:hypothetical protein
VAAVLATVGAAAGVLVHASAVVWAAIVGVLSALLVIIAIASGSKTLRRAMADSESATNSNLQTLSIRLARAEARFALASQFDSLGENGWNDAVDVYAAAVLTGWSIELSQADGLLVPHTLRSPSTADHAIGWRVILPLTREHIDATAKFLTVHGAPLSRLSSDGM